MKNLLLSLILLTVFVLTPGMTCTPSQQQTTYNTIFSVETTTRSAFDAYLDLAIKQSPPNTNGLAQAAFAWNTFQAAERAAIDIAQGNKNSPAPQSLVDAQAKAITVFHGLKGFQ
jgi:hypothetical protein